MEDSQKNKVIIKITKEENLSIIREEALKIFKTEPIDACFQYAIGFYEHDKFQVQELGVFLLGYIADKQFVALSFLREIVSQNPDWRVQEVLAMAFDSFCKENGYEKSLPIIKEWLDDKRGNVRRAATEGLRVWTSRPYFKENPKVAIALLSNLRQDESEYVRKSVGNSIRDISKKFPDLVGEELLKWDTSSKEVIQVYKLASKFIYKA